MHVWVWLRRYWAFIFLGLLALGIAYVAHLGNLLHQRACYTISYLKESYYQYKIGIHYRFRFAVRGGTYTGSSTSEAGMDDHPSARFVVEYDSTGPEENIGYVKLASPNSICQAPANGWRQPPFPVPQWILNRNKQTE